MVSVGRLPHTISVSLVLESFIITSLGSRRKSIVRYKIRRMTDAHTGGKVPFEYKTINSSGLTISACICVSSAVRPLRYVNNESMLVVCFFYSSIKGCNVGFSSSRRPRRSEDELIIGVAVKSR